MADKTLRDNLAYLLADAERRTTAQLARRMRQEGVPVEQWRILAALADGHGHSMGELAAASLHNHPSLTKTLDRMASDALIYRRQDPEDHRRVAVHLSDRGRDLLARLNRHAEAQQRELLDRLGSDGARDLVNRLADLTGDGN